MNYFICIIFGSNNLGLITKMKVTLKKYILVVLGLFMLTACRQNFEWVNINPEKLIAASKAAPYQKGVRNVNITLDLKEKQKETYYNTTEEYIAQNPAPVSPTKSSSKNRYKSVIKSNPQINEQSVSTVSQPFAQSKLVPDTAADKLNGALKIPEKEKSPKDTATHLQFETLKSDESLNQGNQIETKKNLQDELQTVKKDSLFDQFKSDKKVNSLLLAGFVLVILGVILGLIFGKTAFLIAAAGLIFTIIGLILKLKL
jgi:hypothetical protein